MPLKIIRSSENAPLSVPPALTAWWKELNPNIALMQPIGRHVTVLTEQIWPWFFSNAIIYCLENWFYAEIDLRTISVNLRPEDNTKYSDLEAEFLFNQCTKLGTLDLSQLAPDVKYSHPAAFLQANRSKGFDSMMAIYPSNNAHQVYFVFQPEFFSQRANQTFQYGLHLLDSLLCASKIFIEIQSTIAELYATPFKGLSHCSPKEQPETFKEFLSLLFSPTPTTLNVPDFFRQTTEAMSFFTYIDLSDTRLKGVLLMPFGVYHDKLKQYHENIRNIIKAYVKKNALSPYNSVKLKNILENKRNDFLDDLENNSLSAANTKQEEQDWKQLKQEMDDENKKIFSDFLSYLGKYAMIFSSKFQDPVYSTVYKRISEFRTSLQSLDDASREVLKLCSENVKHVNDAVYYCNDLSTHNEVQGYLKQWGESGWAGKKVPLMSYDNPAANRFFSQGLTLKQRRLALSSRFLALQQQQQALCTALAQQYIDIENALISTEKNIGRQSQSFITPVYQREIDVIDDKITYFSGQLTANNNPDIIPVEASINYFIYNELQYMSSLSQHNKFYLARKHVVGKNGLGLKYMGDMKLTVRCLLNGSHEFMLPLTYKLKIIGEERLLYVEVPAEKGDTKLLVPLIYLKDGHTPFANGSLESSLQNKIFSLSIQENKLGSGMDLKKQGLYQ